MPLWLIYHPPTTFRSAATKSALAKDITHIYASRGLPAFYVNVLFIPVEPESYYVGGIARPSKHEVGNEPGPDSERPFVRIAIQNIARKLPHAAAKGVFLGLVDEALKPHIKDQGYDWEYSVEETDRELWKIQGLVPPPNGSEAERVWVEGNRAVEWKL